MAKTVLTDLSERMEKVSKENNFPKQYGKGILVSSEFVLNYLDDEKQQIMDAWIAGREFGCKHDDPKTAEEYYNRTYKSE